MPFKRPGPLPHPSSSSSQPTHNPSKRPKLTALPSIKVFIVQAKLDSRVIGELFALAERHCQKLCSDVEEADVIVTAIGMRKRLERNVAWDVAVSSVSYCQGGFEWCMKL